MSDFNDKPVGILGAVITVEDDLKEIASKLILQTNNIRKQRASKRIRWYNGEMEADMRAVFRQQFEEWDQIQHVIEYENIIKPIIDKTSLVYKDAPVRLVVDAETKELDEDAQKVYDKMQKDALMNVALKKVDRMTTLLNRTVVKAAWRDGHVVLDIITPDILDIIVSKTDPMKPIAMVWAADPVHTAKVTVNRDGTFKVFATEDIKFEFWSTEEHPSLPSKHFIFNGAGVIQKNPANPDNENPYRDDKDRTVIPVAAFASDYPMGDWWLNAGEDLVNGQEVVNKLLTDIQFLAKLQSFSYLVAIGVDTSDVINVGVTELIKLPSGDIGKHQPDMKFITPDAAILELTEVLEKKIRRMAQYRNLSMESFTLTGSPSSGISLKLKNMNLIEDRQDKIELYRPSEQNLFDVMRIVHNEWTELDADKLDTGLEMIIDFAEVKFPEDPAIELQRAEKAFALNLDNPVAWLMRKNPDLNEDQALELLLKNQAINNQMQGRFSGALTALANNSSVLNGNLNDLNGNPNTDGAADAQ